MTWDNHVRLSNAVYDELDVLLSTENLVSPIQDPFGVEARALYRIEMELIYTPPKKRRGQKSNLNAYLDSIRNAG